MTIPKYPGHPVFGNLLAFRGDRLALLTDIATTCGDIGSFRLGGRTIVLVNEASALHTILAEHAYDTVKPAAMVRAIRPLVGKGLFTNEGESHKAQRKLVSPMLHHRSVVPYAETIVSRAERLARSWSDGQRVDIAEAMVQLTLGIVAEVLFHVDVEGSASTLGSALAEVAHAVNARLSTLVPVPLWLPTRQNRRFREAVACVNSVMREVIQSRRAAASPHQDVLAALLAAHDPEGHGLSDQQIRDEAMTLFIAGHETTALTLAWTWELLRQHPAVAIRVQGEVDRVLEGRSPTFDDLAQLPYTLQVLKEVLRLYPPAYILARKPLIPLKVAGCTITPAMRIVISPYALHRRVDYFPEPERFDPDRFSPEQADRIPRDAYLPFGAGARICVGRHLALM